MSNLPANLPRPVANVTGVVMAWAGSSTPDSPRRGDIIAAKSLAVLSLSEVAGKHPATIGSGDVHAWVEEMRGNKLSAATIYARASHVSKFYDWLIEHGQYAGVNPVDAVRPRAPKPYSSQKIKVLTPKQMRALFDVVRSASDAGKVNAMRDDCLLTIMALTGKRRSEPLGLRRRDILIEDDGEDVRIVFTFKTKGAKVEQRELAGDEARKLVERMDKYLSATGRALTSMRDDAPIWLAHDFGAKPRKTKPLTSTGLYLACRRWGKRAGVPGFHPHMLRHTATSAAFEETGSITDAQDFAQHADAKTTRLYVHSIAVQRDRGRSGRIAERLGI